MKSAEDWKRERTDTSFFDLSSFVNFIKEIQLDAYKQGMTESAGIAEHMEIDDSVNYGISESILFVRDNKKEL